MKDTAYEVARLNLVAVIVQKLSPHDLKSRELNKLEKALYEGALRFSARQIMEHGTLKVALNDYEAELKKQRERAEAALQARLNKKGKLGDAVAREDDDDNDTDNFIGG